MKKLISLLAVAAALMIPCAANAAGRTASITNALADRSQIHIIYNDKVVQYEDVKPVNTDGRVMIPFRSALENMGAAVEYDNDTRLVTASKGGTTIKFTLMDDTIYVDKGGAQSTIKMDVPMIIVSDRTLVPIRFMSNAFDMQVGWDGDTETVMILDYEDYFDDIPSIAPNFDKITNISNTQYNKSHTDITLAMDANNIAGSDFHFSLDGGIDSQNAENTSSVDVNVNAAYNGTEYKDISLNAIVKDGQLYVKTNALEKLGAPVSGSQWYKLDINRTIDAMGFDEQTKNILKNAITMASVGATTDLKGFMASSVANVGDATLETTMTLAAQFDVYEQMDKYIKYEDKGNGAYALSISISPEEFISMMLGSLEGIASEEDKAELAKMFNISVSAATDCDGKKAQSDAKVIMKVNSGSESVELSLEMGGTSEIGAQVTPAQIPSDCMDLTETLINFMK